MLYKVVELAMVTDENIERVVNRWCSLGWEFFDMRFVVREGVRRPAMAFVFFTRTDAKWTDADGELTSLDDETDLAAPYLAAQELVETDEPLAEMQPMAAPYIAPASADEVIFEPEELASVTLGGAATHHEERDGLEPAPHPRDGVE